MHFTVPSEQKTARYCAWQGDDGEGGVKKLIKQFKVPNRVEDSGSKWDFSYFGETSSGSAKTSQQSSFVWVSRWRRLVWVWVFWASARNVENLPTCRLLSRSLPAPNQKQFDSIDDVWCVFVVRAFIFQYLKIRKVHRSQPSLPKSDWTTGPDRSDVFWTRQVDVTRDQSYPTLVAIHIGMCNCNNIM